METKKKDKGLWFTSVFKCFFLSYVMSNNNTFKNIKILSYTYLTFSPSESAPQNRQKHFWQYLCYLEIFSCNITPSWPWLAYQMSSSSELKKCRLSEKQCDSMLAQCCKLSGGYQGTVCSLPSPVRLPSSLDDTEDMWSTRTWSTGSDKSIFEAESCHFLCNWTFRLIKIAGFFPPHLLNSFWFFAF